MDVKSDLAVAEFHLSEAQRRLTNAQDDVRFYQEKVARLKSRQGQVTNETVTDSRTLLNG